ncbi:MAG: hypothetical protein V1748_11005 [Actinomycetota bacterium]
MRVIRLALRTANEGFRRWLADARGYADLDADHRHLFWKKVQVAAFLALMPLFVALGAGSRLVGKR